MPFKEGVKDHEVANFRKIVSAARTLDEEVDMGHLTPHEAVESLLKVVEEADLSVLPPPIPEVVVNVKKGKKS